MSLKEDILEQLADDWLLSRPGTFTKHNIKYRPEKGDKGYSSKKDATHSDIDILAIHTKEQGVKRVSVIDCKSWQGGFDPSKWADARKEISGRPAWKSFRAILDKKWADALVRAVKAETGSGKFTYRIVATLVKGKGLDEFVRKAQRIIGNPVQIIDLEEIYHELLENLDRRGATLAVSQVGRLLQVMKAAGLLRAGRPWCGTDMWEKRCKVCKQFGQAPQWDVCRDCLLERIIKNNALTSLVSKYVKEHHWTASALFWHGQCPFCRKSEQFHLSKTRGLYYCFGCHVGGDVFELKHRLDLRKGQKSRFLDVVASLCRRAGLKQWESR
ncbi:MAG: CHC2 zinc finger domain-containing protein [Elusimicrobiota bacterium]